MGPIFGSGGGGGSNQQPFGSQFDPNNPAGGMPPDFSGQGLDQTSPDDSQGDPNVANDWTGGSGLTQNVGSWPGSDNPVYASQAQADLSPPNQTRGLQRGSDTSSQQQSSLMDAISKLLVSPAEASTIRMKPQSGATPPGPGWVQSKTTPPWAGESQTPAPIEADPAAGGHATDIFQQFRDMLFGKPPGPAPQPPPLTETGTGTPAPGTPVPQPRPGAAGQDLGTPTPTPQPRPGVPGQDLGIPTPQSRPGTPGQDLGTSNVPKAGAGGGMVEVPPEAGGDTEGGAGDAGGAGGEAAGAAPNLMSGPFNPLRLIIDLLSGNMGDLMRWFQGQPFQGKEGAPFGQFGKQPVEQNKPPTDTVSPQSAPDSGKTTPPSMTLPWPGGPATGAAPVPPSPQTASFADRFNAIAPQGTPVTVPSGSLPQNPMASGVPGTLGNEPIRTPPFENRGQTAPQATPGGGIPAPQRGQQLSFNDPFVRQMAQIESSNNRYDRTGNNYGLFQFSPDQFRHLGITNPYDPAQQLRALQIETTENMARAQRVLGRDPTGAELYMMHQQGGAALPLIRAAEVNPNAPAWQVASQAYRSSRNPAGMAMSAINQRGFTPRTLGKPVEQVTAKDFVQMWTDRFNRTSRPGMSPNMRRNIEQRRQAPQSSQQLAALAPAGDPNPFPTHRPARNIDSPNINERRNPGVVHDFGPTSDATRMQDWYPLLNTNLQKYRSDTFKDRFQGEPR